MVRGVALASNHEILVDYHDMLRDEHHSYIKDVILPKLLELNANTIRAYRVDTSASHAKTMNLLASKGIYVIVGLTSPSPDDSIDMMTPRYTYNLYRRGTKIIDEFQAYANTFAFLTSNELVFPGEIFQNAQKQSDAPGIEIKAAAADKSFARDMKAYMVGQGYRQVPVGMAMQDGPESSFRPAEKAVHLIGTDVVARYYAYASAPGACADFIGINTYRYIAGGPMTSYDGLANEVSMLNVPVLLTESGGQPNPPTKRDWLIVPQMYTEALLRHNLSGQIAFQFFEMGGQDMGLYIQSKDPTQTDLQHGRYGGVTALKAAFATAKADLPVNLPPSVTPPTKPPAACHPPLQVPFTPPDTSVTFMNYSTYAVAVVQGDYVYGTVAAGGAFNPTSQTFTVSRSLETDILCPSQGWAIVCRVARNTLTNGNTVANNVDWGGACNVTP
jgi:Glucanosyltransferase